jgi:hypothetical protein
MGFWHTGYDEFHEPTGLGAYVYSPPPPVRYTCEHCSESFPTLEELRKHRFELHPLKQPVLLLRGKPVGSLPQYLMTPLHESEIVVIDATNCMLNGKPVPLTCLGQRLSAMRREYIEIELNNQGAITCCQLDFRVADEAHLAGVEASFLRLARNQELNIQSVSRFNDDCRPFNSALAYCDGISHYLYGVMAKEHSPDSGLRHEEYIQRYLRSVDELAGFDRPLSRSVRALVAFHYNHFDDAEYLAPPSALRHAAGAFAGLLQGLPWHFDEAFSLTQGSTIENLLTDQDTLQILADASLGIVGLKARADELLTHLRRAPDAGYDHVKRTLLACEALAARDELDMRVEARKLARALAVNSDTSAWAYAMLERLSKT